MNKILVTGGAGYVGNVLVSELLSKGYNVTVFDNLIHRQNSILRYCGRTGFNFVYGDVRDKKSYRELISANDIIINLAAYVGMPICNKFPNETVQVNRHSVEFLSQTSSPSQHIIYTTTNSGYGLGQHINEKAIQCTEETPLNPISLYGQTKCVAEKILMERGNTTSLRLATVMGVSPKMRLDLLVNDFTWKAWNDRYIVLFESHFLRNFIHIRDVSSAINFSIDNSDKMKGQVYNVGDRRANINKMDLCLRIKKYVPDFFITTSEINKDPDQRNYIVSNEKLENLGWSCKYSLDDAITEVLEACPIIKNSNFQF